MFESRVQYCQMYPVRWALPMDTRGLLLANPMNPAYGLQLLGRVQKRFNLK